MKPSSKVSLRIKSMPSFASFDRVEYRLKELGFDLKATATVVSDGKYWCRRLYTCGSEVVTVSDEIGLVYHMRDPIITICGSRRTIEALRRIL